MGLMKEFRTFAMRGNVVDMAVGIIIGGAFGRIVSSLVSDVIMPPVGKVTGNVDFSSLFVALGKGDFPTLAAAKDAGVATLNYGMFVNTVINFLIVAFAMFMVIKGMNAMQKREEAKPSAPPAPSAEEKLLAEIRDLLKAQSS